MNEYPHRKEGPLTEREFRTLKLIAEGKTHREAGEITGLSTTHSANHMMWVKQKMGASTAAHACNIWGRAQGLLEAASLLEKDVTRNSSDPVDQHVNHVLNELAAYLRRTADRLLDG